MKAEKIQIAARNRNPVERLMNIQVYTIARECRMFIVESVTYINTQYFPKNLHFYYNKIMQVYYT